jgi:Flp pilus assembly protein TadD
MASRALQAPPRRARRPVLRLAAAGLVAVSLAGCLKRSPEMTGSVGSGAASEAAIRSQSQALAARYEANPADPATAIAYARSLRALDQNPQAVAVLQQAMIRTPKSPELLAAYGKALADVGRFKEAADALSRAHTPDRPDWRILSAQGAVADQMGDHAGAEGYYKAALRIVPDEPGVLSNLGLSYSLSKRLPEAERVLTQAAAQPRADARVRQNLALVLGLQGKFAEAEGVLRRDLSAEEAAANLSALRAMVSQSNSWNAIRGAGGAKPGPRRTAGAAEPKA